MKITKEDLLSAVVEEIISVEQADRLYDYLEKRQLSTAISPTAPRFDFTHILYYLGGIVAICAMGLFMNMSWESFGGLGIFSISIIYGIFGLLLTHTFQKRGYHVPAGICATFVVSLTPLAIYGLEEGLYPWSDGDLFFYFLDGDNRQFLSMELTTIIVGFIMVCRYRYPFIIMPIAVALWCMCIDLALMFSEYPDYSMRLTISIYFGLAMLVLALWVDFKTRKTADYAFWLYVFAVLAFWGCMTVQFLDDTISKLFYLATNILMLGLGALLVRRVFVIAGAIGISMYLAYLAFDVFEDSWLFPITLSIIGFLVIFLGIYWQKNERVITGKIRGLLPQSLQDILVARDNGAMDK